MPRFFFHLANGEHVLDERGLVLSDVEAARATAVASARSLLSAEILTGHLLLNSRIVIVEEGEEQVASVEFQDVVEMEGRPRLSGRLHPRKNRPQPT